MRRMVLFVAMAALLAANGCGDKPAPTVTTFSVTVDYSRSRASRAEMIAAGKYDYVSPDITEANFANILISGNGRVEVNLELVHFNRVMHTNDAIIELYELGLRPAILTELLAFGAAYPAEQSKYRVVSLGSSWQDGGGDQFVPFLDRWSGGRLLFLGRRESDWGEDCRFLAVRESR